MQCCIVDTLEAEDKVLSLGVHTEMYSEEVGIEMGERPGVFHGTSLLLQRLNLKILTEYSQLRLADTPLLRTGAKSPGKTTTKCMEITLAVADSARFYAIGHFRVDFCLFLKTSLGAKPFI